MARQRIKASEALAPILEGGRAVNTSDLAEELISALGGTAKFAKLYAEELNNGTRPGTVARARMLEGVMRIVSNSSTLNKDKSTPEDQMTDEDLVNVLKSVIAKSGTEVPLG